MTGIDSIIDLLANKLSCDIDYLDKSFGRAMIFQERRGEKGIWQVPKAKNDNEYELVMPRDQFISQSYFIATTHERFDQFDRMLIGGINRSFAIVFWGKLGIGGVPDCLDEIKFDFIRSLQKSPYITDITDYADETYRQVFPEFVDYIRAQEADTQWLMSPSAGFRLTVSIRYVQPC